MAVDPRIRRRRIEVRRDEGRRRFRVLVRVLVAVGLVAAGIALTRSPLLDVDYVDVRGADLTPRAAVLRAAGLDDHARMIDVDTGKLARRVEALPWVLEASAARDWPGTVKIRIVERTPVAALPVDKGRFWALVDGAGRILAIGPDKPVGFPVIGNVATPSRPGASVARRAAAPLQVVAALSEALRARVSDLALVPGGEVELYLAPAASIVVRLGPPDRLGAKLSALETVLERADLRGVHSVDVRVPGVPVLTRR